MSLTQVEINEMTLTECQERTRAPGITRDETMRLRRRARFLYVTHARAKILKKLKDEKRKDKWPGLKERLAEFETEFPGLAEGDKS